jgi:hypothetical protein
LTPGGSQGFFFGLLTYTIPKKKSKTKKDTNLAVFGCPKKSKMGYLSIQSLLFDQAIPVAWLNNAGARYPAAS